jgi:hypothetical protein
MAVMNEKRQEDWEVLERLLPAGGKRKRSNWERCAGGGPFGNASTLLRVMLIHLIDGCSLRETAVRAEQGGLVAVSDVALLKRLKHCQEWFRWMADTALDDGARPEVLE